VTSSRCRSSPFHTQTGATACLLIYQTRPNRDSGAVRTSCPCSAPPAAARAATSSSR